MRLTVLLVSVMMFSLAPFVRGAMESTNYRIDFDSINSGGQLSTSTNYGLEDTAGEIATGDSSSANYSLSAGYQQADSTFISLTSPDDTLLPPINGLIGGVSTTSVAWTVTTNSPAGYSLMVKASTDPALKSSGSFINDYVPAGPDPDFDFTISATDSEFGFSAEGSDIVDIFKDNGSVCATGVLDTVDSCWAGFDVSDTTIAEGSTYTLLGTETLLKLRAEIGNNHIQDNGTYTAVITVTAVSL